MNKNIVLGVLVVLVVLLGGLYFSKDGAVSFSGMPFLEYQSFQQGAGFGGRNQLSVSNAGVLTSSADATFSGGTLNITTANTATSTVVVGCVQFYATSTATALKYQASTTPGVMYSQYGSCPNL